MIELMIDDARPASTLAGQPFGLEDDLRGALGRAVQLVVVDTRHRIWCTAR